MKNNITNMMCLDMYMSSLNFNEQLTFQKHIQKTDYNVANLVSWDIHLQNYHQITSNLEIDKDLAYIKNLAKQYNWENNIDSIINNNSFEAIVITDLSRKIVWVNNGFTDMTGYPKNFALNKTPNFLQGSETSEATKKRIRKKLQNNEPFKEIIINHKKDRTSYKCEVQIFPLYNKETTHFLALEKKVI